MPSYQVVPSGQGGGLWQRGKRWLGGLTNQPGAEEQREGLQTQSGLAGNFAGVGEAGYGRLGGELGAETEYMRDIARGRESVSAEQLRQALQQQQAQAQSMSQGGPASAAPMMARTALLGAGRASSAMAGQQALAGIQERQAAQQALAQMLLGQRGQDLQAALGGRGHAIGALGGITPGQSPLQQYGGLIQGGLQTYLGSK